MFRDSRYTVDWEYTGASHQKMVLRFCGDFVACGYSYQHMIDCVELHSKQRTRR